MKIAAEMGDLPAYFAVLPANFRKIPAKVGNLPAKITSSYLSVSPLSIKKSEKSQPPDNGQLASMAPYMARPQCRCMAMLLIKFSLADASPALISTIPISDRVCDCPSVSIASGGSSSAPSPPNAMVLKCL